MNSKNCAVGFLPKYRGRRGDGDRTVTRENAREQQRRPCSLRVAYLSGSRTLANNHEALISDF